jgi:hypothetical protein
MADQPVQKHPDGGPHDTTDYSASKAPETRESAIDGQSPSDTRLVPGGVQGSPADVGMSGIDEEQVPSHGRKPDQLDMSDSPDDGSA